MVRLNEALADAKRRAQQENLARAEMRRLRDFRLRQGAEWSHRMDDLVLMFPAERGQAVQLTYEERVKLGIRKTRPADISWSEVQRRNRQRRNEKDAAKKRALRAARKAKPAGLTTRERDLLDLIPADGRPIPASALVVTAAAIPSFRNRKGVQPSKSSLRQSVQRVTCH